MKACVARHFPSPTGTRQGFTLIELLLAIVISAVVLAAMNGVFFGAMRLRNRVADQLNVALPLQNALAVLRRDLMGIQLPDGEFSGNLNSNATLTGENETDTGTQIYTSTGPLTADLPWGDIQRVAYVLRSPTNRMDAGAGRDLVRVVIRNPLPAVNDEPIEQRLLSGVELLEFGFYDGQTWRNTWNSTNETLSLPRAIRATLTLSAPRNRGQRVAPANVQRPIHQLVVPIVLAAKTNAAVAAATTGAAP